MIRNREKVPICGLKENVLWKDFLNGKKYQKIAFLFEKNDKAYVVAIDQDIEMKVYDLGRVID